MIENAVQPRTEGPVARSIEHHTSKLPSDWFLWAAIGAVSVSFALQLADRRERSLFFGQWVPTLLLLGAYNKIVKVAGHDARDPGLPNPSPPTVPNPGFTR